MAEEFQGGVCGSTWWNPPSLFPGAGAGGLSPPCSVAQLGTGGGGGSFHMGGFGWPNEALMKGSNNNNKPMNLQHTFDNSLVFPADMDSTLDILGFGLSPTSSTTTNWSQPSLICAANEGNYGSILLQDQSSEMNSSNVMSNNYMNNNCNNLDSSPTLAASSSNSPGDSSTITSEGGLINSSFSMNSSASYLIQTLFDDTDESQVIEPQVPISQPMNPNYGCVMSSNDQLMSSQACSWVKPSSTNIAPPIQPPPPLQLGQNHELNGGMNLMVNNGGHAGLNGQYSTATTLSNIRASLLNSLKSRSRAPLFNNQKLQSCDYLGSKVSKEEVRDSKTNMNDQSPAKRLRIETPSPLPTFKVRKEKLGDRITALQQLVSPFGKTDTASVLHEAIEYIKFLHDQVNALSTPYLKNGAPKEHQQENEQTIIQDLKSRGLCLVPISSTYPVVQETPVDFWTPTFGGPAFR